MTGEYINAYHARVAHILAAFNSQVFKPSDTENVVVIGKTGSGKSSIISLLLGHDIGVGHGIYSKTTHTTDYNFDIPARNGARKIKLIDTQGVLDAEIDLMKVLESLIDGLTGRFYHVNTIILVLECARFTRETQDALESLVRAFGLDDIERSKRLLVVVTKVEHLPVKESDEILGTIIEHDFFKKFDISVEYLQKNTIKAFEGQSEGARPHLVPGYKEMREATKTRLLSALARNNSPMTVSNDFAQKLTNFLTDHMETVKNVSALVLRYVLRT